MIAKIWNSPFAASLSTAGMVTVLSKQVIFPSAERIVSISSQWGGRRTRLLLTVFGVIAMVSMVFLAVYSASRFFRRWRQPLPPQLSNEVLLERYRASVPATFPLSMQPYYVVPLNISQRWGAVTGRELLDALVVVTRLNTGSNRIILREATPLHPYLRVSDVIRVIINHYPQCGISHDEIEDLIAVLVSNGEGELRHIDCRYHNLLRILIMSTDLGIHPQLREELITPFGLRGPCYSEIVVSIIQLRITHLMVFCFEHEGGRVFVQLKHQADNIQHPQHRDALYSLSSVRVEVADVRVELVAPNEGVDPASATALRQYADRWVERAQRLFQATQLGEIGGGLFFMPRLE